MRDGVGRGKGSEEPWKRVRGLRWGGKSEGKTIGKKLSGWNGMGKFRGREQKRSQGSGVRREKRGEGIRKG